jgi:histidinol-phosphatase (PHP family)
MFLSNYHSHCSFCDGRSSMEEFVCFAIAKGVKKYGFSSHAPLPFDTFWNMRTDDLPEYKAEFYRLKEKYDGQIELYLGMEIDYIPDCFDATKAFYPTGDLDYLIGSIHYLDTLPEGGFMSIDGNFDKFRHGLKARYDGDIQTLVDRYFAVSRAMVEKGGFQIVGHVDKIAMNGSRCDGFNKNDKHYRQLVGELFTLIKSKGMIVEINTKSLMEKGITYPDQQFFPLLRELRIPVTVNSDCHYPTNILDGFSPTYKALKTAGITTIHQLVNGSWQALEFE